MSFNIKDKHSKFYYKNISNKIRTNLLKLTEKEFYYQRKFYKKNKINYLINSISLEELSKKYELQYEIRFAGPIVKGQQDYVGKQKAFLISENDKELSNKSNRHFKLSDNDLNIRNDNNKTTCPSKNSSNTNCKNIRNTFFLFSEENDFEIENSPNNDCLIFKPKKKLISYEKLKNAINKEYHRQNNISNTEIDNNKSFGSNNNYKSNDSNNLNNAQYDYQLLFNENSSDNEINHKDNKDVKNNNKDIKDVKNNNKDIKDVKNNNNNNNNNNQNNNNQNNNNFVENYNEISSQIKCVRRETKFLNNSCKENIPFLSKPSGNNIFSSMKNIIIGGKNSNSVYNKKAPNYNEKKYTVVIKIQSEQDNITKNIKKNNDSSKKNELKFPASPLQKKKGKKKKASKNINKRQTALLLGDSSPTVEEQIKALRKFTSKLKNIRKACQQQRRANRESTVSVEKARRRQFLKKRKLRRSNTFKPLDNQRIRKLLKEEAEEVKRKTRKEKTDKHAKEKSPNKPSGKLPSKSVCKSPTKFVNKAQNKSPNKKGKNKEEKANKKSLINRKFGSNKCFTTYSENEGGVTNKNKNVNKSFHSNDSNENNKNELNEFKDIISRTKKQHKTINASPNIRKKIENNESEKIVKNSNKTIKKNIDKHPFNSVIISSKKINNNKLLVNWNNMNDVNPINKNSIYMQDNNGNKFNNFGHILKQDKFSEEIKHNLQNDNGIQMNNFNNTDIKVINKYKNKKKRVKISNTVDLNNKIKCNLICTSSILAGCNNNKNNNVTKLSIVNTTNHTNNVNNNNNNNVNNNNKDSHNNQSVNNKFNININNNINNNICININRGNNDDFIDNNCYFCGDSLKNRGSNKSIGKLRNYPYSTRSIKKAAIKNKLNSSSNSKPNN